jgi:hypothetical protein
VTIDHLKTLFEIEADKYQLRYLPGDEFNIIANIAQRDYFNFLIGHIEQFQPGRPVPRIGLGMGAGVMDKLSPFRKISTPAASSGQITKPAKIKRLNRMAYGSLEIKRIEIDQLSAALDSALAPIATHPRYVDIGSKWQIYPIALLGASTVTLDYIEEPTDMNWKYTIVNGRENYLASGSVHPQWADTDMGHILSRMLAHFGVATQDYNMVNVANNRKDRGE